MGSFKLLTMGNPKLAKGEKQGYLSFVLHLAPAKLSGYQVCPMATAGCRAACLNTAGRGGMMAGVSRLTEADVAAGLQNTIQKARIRKTKLFFEDREQFLDLLVREVRKGIRYAKQRGFTPVFRLNGTSDIRWEAVRIGNSPSIMAMFPDVQFYDYTKIANRRNVPSNYALTFSLADGNDVQAFAALAAGFNVAAVFRKDLPETFMGRAVVNGDETDLRFLDPKGVIVGLKAKGNAKRDTSGFVRA
jgi:hypothetical protein